MPGPIPIAVDLYRVLHFDPFPGVRSTLSPYLRDGFLLSGARESEKMCMARRSLRMAVSPLRRLLYFGLPKCSIA